MEGDSGAQLFVVLFLMFFGALGAGYLPYVVTIRESRLQTVSALGGGLLIGSALTVIIPEGFHAFNQAAAHHDHSHHDHHGHDHSEVPEGLTGLALVAGFLGMLILDQLQAAAGGDEHHHHHAHTSSSGGASTGGGGGGKHTRTSSTEQGQDLSHTSGFSLSSHDLEKAGNPLVGLLPDAAPPPPVGKPKGGSPSSPDRAITGLLIHCAADGLAMGSAFLSGNAALSLVVGTAMVLHKAPMAFGLATYLMACRWPWAKAQRTLILFAAAAPVATVVTFTLLRVVPLFTTPVAVSLAILFSGGTFLHAATMHILPEVAGGGGCGHGHMDIEQLVAVSLGCVLPALLSWGHHH